MMPTGRADTDRFDYDVALSFAGEDRDTVEALASILREQGCRVFYDRYEQATMWGKDLVEHLTDIYQHRALYCVMFLSGSYYSKMWAQVEQRAAYARAIRESREYVLPVRLDDSPVPDVLASAAYLDLRSLSIVDVARFLFAKLRSGAAISAHDESLPLIEREFQLGPLRAPVILLEGNGERAIPRANVITVVDPTDAPVPAIVSEWRREHLARIEELSAAGSPAAWNGRQYAVKNFVNTRHGLSEEPGATITFQLTDYCTFLATQELDRLLPNGRTLRTEYLAGRDPRKVATFMRSCFGLNMAVVTADNFLLLSRRTDEVAVGRNLWNSSANESLSLDKDSDPPATLAPNLFSAANRGLREELGLDQDMYELELMAFHVVTSLSQWGALFLARLSSITRDTLSRRLTRGAEDSWEHSQFEFIRFDPDTVLKYLIRPDRIDNWGEAAPVLFYLSLVRVFGKRQVDDIVDRLDLASPTE